MARDDNLIIIELLPTQILARWGISSQDVIRVPSVSLKGRVGWRRRRTTRGKRADEKPATTIKEKVGDEETKEGGAQGDNDDDGIEILNGGAPKSPSNGHPTSPTTNAPSFSTPPKVSDYLVGTELDEALRKTNTNEEFIQVRWPLWEIMDLGEIGVEGTGEEDEGDDEEEEGSKNKGGFEDDEEDKDEYGDEREEEEGGKKKRKKKNGVDGGSSGIKELKKRREEKRIELWNCVEALFHHILHHATTLSLPTPPSSNLQLLLLLPSLIPPKTNSNLTSMFYNKLEWNSGLCIFPREVAGLFGAGGGMTGVMVDLAGEAPELLDVEYLWRDDSSSSTTTTTTTKFHDRHLSHPPSTILPILDSDPLPQHSLTLPLSLPTLNLYLSHLLLTHVPDLPTLLSTPTSATTTGKKSLEGKRLYRALMILCRKLRLEGELWCDLDGTGSEDLKPILGDLIDRLRAQRRKKEGGNSGGGGGEDEEEEEGITDVAKDLMSGKVNRIIGGSSATGSAQKGAGTGTGGGSGSGSGGQQQQQDPSMLHFPHPLILSTNPHSNNSHHTNRPTIPIPRWILGRWMDPIWRPELLRRCGESFEREGVGMEGWGWRVDEINNMIPIQEAIRLSISNTASDSCLSENDQNQSSTISTSAAASSLWEGVGLLGWCASIKGFSQSLSTILSTYVPSPESLSEDHQPPGLGQGPGPGTVKILKIPEYFSDYRDRPELISFLGGCITAKLAFSDSSLKLTTNKSDFSAYGPRAAQMVEAP